MSQIKNNEISTKIFFIKYGIFSGFIAVLLFILIYSSLVARNSWNNNLKICVEKCLNENQPGEWSVGAFVEINSPFSTAAACYETRNKRTGELYYSCITRLTSFFGPINCVFICSQTGEVSFVGVSALQGRVREILNSANSSVRIKIFAERLPLILGIKVEENKVEENNV